MIRKTVSATLFSLMIAILVSSCGTSKHSSRKCDGRKGQKTPMGRI